MLTRTTKRPSQNSSSSRQCQVPGLVQRRHVLAPATRQPANQTPQQAETGYHFGDIPVLQPKLRMGQPNDRYEQEADRVADQIMGMPQPGSQFNPVLQKSQADSAMRLSATQARLVPAVSPGFLSSASSTRDSGRPLPTSSRTFFESRFGHDFSQVRIHDNPGAANMAHSISARAFIMGRDIRFATGQYQPETSQGKKLLAHELTHVVQQGWAGQNKRHEAKSTEAHQPAGSTYSTNGTGQVPIVAAPVSGAAPNIQASFISFALKMGAKKVATGTLKNFIKTQIRGKINKIAIKRLSKKFAKEADDLIGILEDPWWATAIGFIPVIGDAFDLGRVPYQIQKAMKAADRLEAKVKKILQIQGQRAGTLVLESIKKVKGYPSELEHLTYTEIVKMAGSSAAARKMKKLIEQEHRLFEKPK